MNDDPTAAVLTQPWRRAVTPISLFIEDMGTEILPEVCFSPAPSSFDRPFRIHVQDRTFLIDAESMRKISPVFSVMCYGKDFEGGRELSREIVDEKCGDIDVFLRAVHDNSVIKGKFRDIPGKHPSFC
ncbi:hypothetical protein ANCDUO_14826 [Ancylostoma duodenale]|uniref:BTB domain-containing protein n=1 Tax=Ancylostoma duodenale TaxID=51022 RepID=A0A0C2G256_9BILA|nr:hypothetical protein ANCDUO_14826 [Ancylostoma duodenale]